MKIKLGFRTQTAVAALLVFTGGAHAAAPDQPEEITVTATKRTTALEKTPIAITALSAATLEQHHIQTIADAVHLVPSFAATSEGDHDVITLTLRGVGNDAAKTEYADPEVALFVDGVYAPRPEGATSLLFDLQSVEVLRGPQGTLWGRNSTVGAVNMQTAKPSIDGGVFGYVEGGVGDFDRFGVKGALNLPLTNQLAIRAAFIHEQHDGYVDYQSPIIPSLASQMAAAAAAGIPASQFRPINANLFVQSGAKYNAQDQSAFRLSALWTPTNAITWNVSYERFLDRGTPDANLLQNPRPGQPFWSTLADVGPYVNRDVDTLRSRLDVSLNDYLGLTYVAGYSWFSGTADFAQDGGAIEPTSFATGSTYQEDRTTSLGYFNYSHELQLKSQGSHTVDWILGAYYAAENNNIRFDIPIFNGTQDGTVGYQGSFVQPKETVESTAFFAQATANVTDAIHLTGGVRWTDDHRGNLGGLNINCGGVPTPISVGTNTTNTPGCAPYQFNTGRYKNTKTTWLGRADFNVTQDFLAYASVSTGYKSGGLQDGGLPYLPETLTNYEVGTKNSFFSRKVTWNNAAFYEDFKGFQFSQPVTNPDGTHSLAISNTQGSTTVYGFESELAARITPDDVFSASLALLHTKLGQLYAGSNDYTLPACPIPGIGSCLNVSGHQLAHAPSASGQLTYDHTFHIGDASLVSHVSTHLETASWLSVFNLGAGDRQTSYSRTDASLRYISPKNWSVEAYVQNLEDGRIKTVALDPAGGSFVNAQKYFLAQYLPPRTYGFNVRYEF